MTFAEETILFMNARAVQPALCPADKLLAVEKHAEGFTYAVVQRYPDTKRNAGEVLNWHFYMEPATLAARRNGHFVIVKVSDLIS
jgi:hypothetical protein